jgi:endonuclease III
VKTPLFAAAFVKAGQIRKLPAMAVANTDWAKAIRPLLRKYQKKKHPLEYQNAFQLMVMVVLSAQSTDDAVNKIAPALFEKYPNLMALAKAKARDLFPQLKGIRNFAHKAAWLTKMAHKLKTDSAIPKTMDDLIRLPGIGRKSANVIRREMGLPPEGIIVDLHVVRVARRLGIVTEEEPKKIEAQLMKTLPKKEWDAGMAMSFLGREICRPKPKCEICPMNLICAFFKESQ